VVLLVASSATSEDTKSSLNEPIDLGSSDASFIGEGVGDESGYSVGGAGDVNGDGYDDFLISAHMNNDAHVHAGQVYLVFGRVSGWSMDTNLSNVNASFVGEEPYDEAGISATGVGDVNGDGYYDIVIGAHRSDTGGDNAGQAYLILGRSSGWSMDTDLSSSDASFVGENKEDQAGLRVAGAGDLDADGFDDIIISAPNYNRDVGKTYLIYGKSSGWSMDTNLSDADASFTGQGGSSGSAIDGVGDFNGDGYDDFVIGARRFGTGGATYLLFGGSSRYSNDTNLVNVNASFVGTHDGDLSGCAVSRAGDINGDGYDDFLIGAYGINMVYVIFGNYTGWEKKYPLANITASFVDKSDPSMAGYAIDGAGDINQDGYPDFIIGAPGVSDNGNGAGKTYLIQGKSSGWSKNVVLSKADEAYVGEDATDVSGSAVAMVGDVNGDGYGDIIIGAYYDEEGGSKAGQTYLVLGKDGRPRFELDSSSDTATTGDGYTFNVTVSDNSGVNNVTVEYWYEGDANHTNVTMDRISGDRLEGAWESNISIPQNSTASLSYRFHAWDSGREARTIVKTVTVTDDDPPSIVDDFTPMNATTYDDHTFSVRAEDNIGVTRVNVEYWYGQDGTHTNVTMTSKGSGVWEHTILTPLDSLETIHYFFYCRDGAKNDFTSSIRNVSVIDDDAPLFISDSTPDEGTTGEPFEFMIEVEDNVAISQVLVEYWYVGSTVKENRSMEQVSTFGWSMTVTIPLNRSGIIQYQVTAWDSSLNQVTWDINNVTILDNDDPVITKDHTPSTTTTGEVLEIQVEASDNIGVAQVLLVSWFGTGGARSQSALVEGPTGTWGTPLSIPGDSTEVLYYQVRVLDTSSNQVTSSTREVVVMDNDPPIFTEDLSTRSATTGGEVVLSICATDNIGIANVLVRYQFGEGAWVQEDIILSSGPPWNHVLAVPMNEVAPLNYQFQVMDDAKNYNVTSIATIHVIDIVAPLLGIPSVSGDPIKGKSISVRVGVEDNIAVQGVHVEYWFHDGSHINKTVDTDDPEIIIDIPRNPPGDLHLFFSATDGEGNWNATDTISVSPRNAPPIATDIPDWDLTEGVLGHFDLSEFVHDGNDDLSDLAISCDNDDVQIDGMTLSARYDMPIGPTTLEIWLTDGEDSVQVNITMNVLPVNDPPIILDVQPRNGSEFKQGSMIVLRINTTDEEGDELSIRWMEDSAELGVGNDLEVKLKPGNHVITVVVDDGTDQVEDTLTLVVQKRESKDSPGPSTVVALFALATAVIIMRSRLERKGHRGGISRSNT